MNNTILLGQLVDVKGGKRLPKGEKLSEVDTGYPYIRIVDFNNLTVNKNEIKYLNPEIQAKISRYIINKEDVYISIAGTLGMVGTIPEDLDGANLTENAARLIIRNPNELDKDYLKFYLSSPSLQQNIKSRGLKNAQPKLSLSNIKLLPVNLIPLQIQRKHVYILSLFQKAIEQQEWIIETTTELKKSLMQKLFTEGLHGEPQKETEIGLIPESWKLVSFGEVASFKNGINFAKQQKGKIGILTIDVLNMYGKDMTVDFSNLYRVNKKIPQNSDYLLQEGDILFVRSSLKPEGVGWVSIYQNNSEPTTYCGFIINTRLFDKNSFIPLFYAYYFRSDVARRIFLGTSRVSITNINQGLLKSMLIPKPSKLEQQEIVETFINLDQRISTANEKKKTIRGLFNSLLHQLMSGELRVDNINLN